MKATPTFYVFHGSDSLTRQEKIAELCQRLSSEGMAELNIVRLDGGKTTLEEVRQACTALPFLASRRLVIITGLLSRLNRKGDAFLEGLLALLPRLPETTRLILAEEEALNDHPVVKLAQQHERGYVYCFEPPSASALPAWIEKRARHHGGEIEPAAARRLAESVGTDLRLLDQEILKLIAYAGAGRAVTVADVEKLVPYVKEAVIFDLVDALGQRDGRHAAATLQQLLDEGKEADYILFMVVRHFRLLTQVKALKNAGENSASIAARLRLHTFPARKLYEQANNFTTEQLEQVHRQLLKTDVQVKSGELSSEMALDLLVAGLAGEG